MNYYYKSKDGNGTLCLLSKIDKEIASDYEQITEEQYLAIVNKYIEPTAEQIKKRQIAAYKKQLQETDYLAIKYFEGWISEEEYAPIKAQRQAWRDEIGKLGG